MLFLLFLYQTKTTTLKNLKLPSPHTILIIITGLVALLTWIIPSGKFDTLKFDTEAENFVYLNSETRKTLPATQQTLDDLSVTIALEKFTSGDIYKPIGIPKTYKELAPQPQGFLAFLKAPIQGIIQSADIIFFVLILGGLIGIMNYTGAFDAGISWLGNTLKSKEYLLIIIVTTLVSIGGTTFGLAEETIAFYPILIPIFIAAGYDAMVPLACIYIGSSVGSMFSTINPFSVIIASDAAGINWTTGFTGRLILLILATIISIIYILRYAKKVKKDTSKSIVYKQKEAIEKLFKSNTNDSTLTARLRTILTVFGLCFIVMIIGVSKLDWWFEEMTVTFLIGAILIGFLANIKEDTFISIFVKGASDLLSVAFIIGIARAVSIVMDNGLISDTILHYASGITGGMPKGIFTNVMLFIYAGLSFFVPSSSGMAVLTMPIMSPLADTVGIGREVIVNAYQYGMGLFAFINPTGLILPSLAIVKIGFNSWLKFITPLLIILTLFTMIGLTIQVYL